MKNPIDVRKREIDRRIKNLQKTAKQLAQLFDVVLKISKKDYRIVVSERIDGAIDVYFRDDLFKRQDVTIAFKTVELFVSDSWRIASHWGAGKHGFDDLDLSGGTGNDGEDLGVGRR
jgi:hypothetical protein